MIQKNRVDRMAWHVDRMDRLLRVPRNGPCRLTILIDDFEFDYDNDSYWPTSQCLDYEGGEALSAFSNDEKIDWD